MGCLGTRHTTSFTCVGLCEKCILCEKICVCMCAYVHMSVLSYSCVACIECVHMYMRDSAHLQPSHTTQGAPQRGTPVAGASPPLQEAFLPVLPLSPGWLCAGGQTSQTCSLSCDPEPLPTTKRSRQRQRISHRGGEW